MLNKKATYPKGSTKG